MVNLDQFNNPPKDYVYLKWNGLFHLIRTQQKMIDDGLWWHS